MRVFGMILVILGALTLGYQGFLTTGRDSFSPDGPRPVAREGKDHAVAIPPIMGGIAVTSGLILIVSGMKRV